MTPFIKQLIERKCFTVSPAEPLKQVIKKLAKHNIGALVVTNKDGIIKGLVSERDIVQRLAKFNTLDDLIASDVMTQDVISVTTNVTSSELMRVMTEKKCRHLPILLKSQLVGIVSIGDVVKRLLEKYQDEAEQLRSFINS